MYAHTTWPPPGGTTGTPTGAPHRADGCTSNRAPRHPVTARPDADASDRSPRRADADASNQSPRRAATAPGFLGRWGR
ncbi:hypothetical protein [Streptomyces sp. NPDC056056]|uniref:hypothetical protein n=1 Tax=Streptomyces sp. NPDC056056 TaxID=3345698 RepID=UPI0035DDC6F1